MEANANMKLNLAAIEYYKNNPVTTVDLEAESQDTASIRAFAEMLKDHHFINFLMFSESNIDDEQVQFLAAAIAKNQSLRFIDLSNNPITERGITYVSQALQDNYFIKGINLSYIELTPSSIERLNQAICSSRSIIRVIPEDIMSSATKQVVADNRRWQEDTRAGLRL